jgi:hypothetical protein
LVHQKRGFPRTQFNRNRRLTNIAVTTPVPQERYDGAATIMMQILKPVTPNAPKETEAADDSEHHVAH